jgi:putative transposase
MDEYESLSHTTWDWKYHVVLIPKCRRKTLYQELRRHLGEVFRKLAHQKESKVEFKEPPQRPSCRFERLKS